jgi:uncharacterized membrane protein YfcA
MRGRLTLPEAIAVFAAGVFAGGINAVVGSGSLVTFPTLLAFGVPPVLANVSNNVGLVPGSASGAFGYRRELAGQRGRLLRFGAASAVGSAIGGILLLELPASTFKVIVPVLILVACVLVVLQPRLNAWLAARRTRAAPHGGVPLLAGLGASGVYGGYFGAAQGVILLALLGITLDDDLQRLNGVKNVVAAVVNAVAAVWFIAVRTEIDWVAVVLLLVGSTIGGQAGAVLGRRIPASTLRAVIAVVGTAVAVKLLLD